MGLRLCSRLAVALGASLLSCAAFADVSPTDNSLPLFENLLSNTSDVAANLAYAQSLQAAGRIDEARTIYRKVLGLDPNNETANAALAQLGNVGPPAQTNYTLRWGGAFETNVPRRPPNFNGNDGWVGFAELTVNDTRQLAGMTVQSNLDLYSNGNTRFPSVEISYAALDTGPIADLGSAGKLRVAVGGEYLLQGTLVNPGNGNGTRKFTFDAADLIFNYFPPGEMALQSVNALVGYDNFNAAESFRNGVVMRTTAPFVFLNVTPFHTQLIATPGFVYNGAGDPTAITPRPAHYSELDLDLLTLTPLADNQLGAEHVVGKLGLFSDLQFYDSRDPLLTSSNRQDQRIVPLIGLRLLNFATLGIQVDLDYRYDRNFSNDPSERFEDHIFSLTGTYRF
jgi:hypothetical protein